LFTYHRANTRRQKERHFLWSKFGEDWKGG
jgi:hypothetical protein